MTETPRYQVLARKYRPETFADLVGQDAMVRTLKNAFEAGRIAQAFIMTGIRGTGKTTTARIIAKGLNCIGPDGQGGPTTAPCGECEHCRAIIEGRHVDVLEMDAASRTGVGDIREIIDSVHYRAASARYKVYIIDEVHMLSTSAFNALLKTLEEPPPHVKFIFATTEIRKVPVTVLSRCQRFDLRRIEPEVMIGLLNKIATAEGATISEAALALITRAAEGSARDATSLLDQAISHGAGETGADQVRAMLGLADRGRVLDLFEMIMKGDAAGALSELGGQYSDGADPMAVLRDLAEITHWISVLQVTPDAGDDPTVPPEERSRGLDLAGRLSKRSMSRMWQMLLKALEEVALAPNAMMAAEMAVIRLTHVSELPDPGSLIRQLEALKAQPGGIAGAMSGGGAPQGGGTRMQAQPMMPAGGGGYGQVQASGAAVALAQAQMPVINTVAQLAELIHARRDMKLYLEVKACVRPVRFAPGRIEFQPTEDARPDLAARLAASLQRWTGQRWGISVTSQGGGATLDEDENAELIAQKTEAQGYPLVQAVLAAFPGAQIRKIRPASELLQEAAVDALAEVEDEWDPFDED